MSNVQLGYTQVIDPISFKSIPSGKIYIGEYGTLPNPSNAGTWKQAYFVNSDGTRVAASQPIRTNAAGFAVDGSGNIKTVQVDGGYSLLAQDQFGATKFSQAKAQEVGSPNGAAMVGTSSGETVQQLFDVIFGVLSVADEATGISAIDTATIEAAFNSGKRTLIPAGTYVCNPFTITGKHVDVEFMAGARLVFSHQENDSAYFYQCSGNIRGEFVIEDTAESVSGVYCTFLARECVDLHIESYTVYGGKDLPFAMVDCDNCMLHSGAGIGNDTNRPFAWQLIGCKNTKISNARLYKYDFGITLIGPGYKSGTRANLMTTRAYSQTVGMGVINSYVEDHQGHAFDMNGTVGGYFEQCTAYNYTGTVGNSSFQVKQSTNVGEVADDTFANRITDCFAIDCVGGFGAQEGTDVQMRGLHVVNCKRYPVVMNSTKRFIVDGVIARDWGLDLATWPLQNADTECAIVAVWASSNTGTVQGVRGSLTNTSNPNIGVLSLVSVVGSNVTVDDVNVSRETGVTTNLYTAMRISGSNCQVGYRFRCGGAIYSQNPIIDTTSSTIYPLEYGVNVSLASVATTILQNMPQRGLVVGKIYALSTTAPTGSPTYSVGSYSSPATLVAARAAPATSEFVDPLTTLNTNTPLAVRIPVAGTGQLQVSIRGVSLL